ncbi:C6 transcription factor [Fusarium acuminatum]|uniref:C6 transcription factor n=1 Tax=Fusarium acuminatum TaxID=5515 RepID=A0ABZ2WKS8_9HYPO
MTETSKPSGRPAVSPLQLDSPRTVSVLEIEEQSNAEKCSEPSPNKELAFRSLSPAEWTFFARGVGGIRDAERNVPIQPTSRLWPPKGLPLGLYRDTVYSRTMSSYMFQFASAIRWIFLILQLMIGASLTALGGMSTRDGTPITVLGASNTVIAGLLALLHNSGVPDRYRYDKAEFERVEDHIRELLVTGLVRADKSVNEALSDCFDYYQHAKRTVNSNMPAAYVPTPIVPTAQAVATVPVCRPQPVLQQPMMQGTEPKGPISPLSPKALKTSSEEEEEEKKKEEKGPTAVKNKLTTGASQ